MGAKPQAMRGDRSLRERVPVRGISDSGDRSAGFRLRQPVERLRAVEQANSLSAFLAIDHQREPRFAGRKIDGIPEDDVPTADLCQFVFVLFDDEPKPDAR